MHFLRGWSLARTGDVSGNITGNCNKFKHFTALIVFDLIIFSSPHSKLLQQTAKCTLTLGQVFEAQFKVHAVNKERVNSAPFVRLERYRL